MSEERIVEHAAENTAMRADNVTALRINNPCGHTGFESFACEICGYPDPRRVIAKLREKQAELRDERDRLRERLETFADFILEECDEWALAHDAARKAKQVLGGDHD